MEPGRLPMGHMNPMQLQSIPMHPHMQRRSLLLEVRSNKITTNCIYLFFQILEDFLFFFWLILKDLHPSLTFLL